MHERYISTETDGGDISFTAAGGLPAFTGSDGISTHYQILALGNAIGGQLNAQVGR